MFRKCKACFIIWVVLVIGFPDWVCSKTETVSRRDIDVSYSINRLQDGFGNVRQLQVSGFARNNSPRIASRIQLSFTFILKNRESVSRRLELDNLVPEGSLPFEFSLDFGTQPDILESVICNLDQITFSATREASPLTPFHLVTHELYSLPRLNEEGRSFIRTLQYIRGLLPFKIPVKDEFETSTEYENRINNAENHHFSRMMDELEKRYGLLLGGSNTRIRFLPRTFRNHLVYVSESSAYFQVPVSIGRYNADSARFENIMIHPRTFPFSPKTHVPINGIQFIHRSGMFFLRASEFPIDRDEAQIWRSQDKSMILEGIIRFGVKQDGPYFQDFCVVEKIVLKNRDTGEVFREWQINP